ncbi:MAG TPA: hypothetical protein VJV75_03760 [Candidatus Polarisedimenticolia bacterium]|nr:hypothetical protein [Candidatus Polarisedimenticolia bacterium]
MRFTIGLVVGAVVGVVAYWIYAHREELGWVVRHRDTISSGSNLIESAKEFWGTL